MRSYGFIYPSKAKKSRNVGGKGETNVLCPHYA